MAGAPRVRKISKSHLIITYYLVTIRGVPSLKVISHFCFKCPMVDINRIVKNGQVFDGNV